MPRQDHVHCWASTKFESEDVDALVEYSQLNDASSSFSLVLFGGKIREHGPEVALGPCGAVSCKVSLLSAMEACARNLSVTLLLIVRLPGTCEGSGSCRLRGSRCHATTWSGTQLRASAPILSYLGARLSYLIPSKHAPIYSHRDWVGQNNGGSIVQPLSQASEI